MATSPLYAEMLPAQGRQNRYPRHTWHLRHRPWQIVPCMIAPVLPGETLKNALIQARVVSDPVKNPLIGWWHEYYFFYVKHRDLAGSADFQAMVLEYGTDMSAYKQTTAHDVDYFTAVGTMKWAKMCTEAVVGEYFRREGEALNISEIGGYYAASHNLDTWLDSLTLHSALDTSNPLPDDADNATLDEVSRMQQQWEFMRAMKLTEMSYEDFLRTYGVTVRKEVLNKPELLRFMRAWSYPTNTIDPTDGSPSSALSWAIQERIDKDRFFREPGFILGLTVSRPKIYFSGQKGSGVGLLDDALAWLPAIMRQNPETSLKLVGANSGPCAGITTDYWVDLRDLLVYGDQQINFALSATDANLCALPEADADWRYPTAAMADALFASASPANQIRQDGVCALTIAGTQADMT